MQKKRTTEKKNSRKLAKLSMQKGREEVIKKKERIYSVISNDYAAILTNSVLYIADSRELKDFVS